MTNEAVVRVPRYLEVSFTYVENTAEFSDFESIVDDLGQDFFLVKVTRRIAGPMAGGILAEPAVMFTIGAAAGPFLAELGKDAYAGVKAAIFSLYRRAKTTANSRGYVPLAARVHFDDQRFCQFTFPPDLSQEEFEKALMAIAQVWDEQQSQQMLEYQYEANGSWGEPYDPFAEP